MDKRIRIDVDDCKCCDISALDKIPKLRYFKIIKSERPTIGCFVIESIKFNDELVSIFHVL